MKTTFTNKPRTFSKKYITAIALLLLICGWGWAQTTYTWTGGAGTTDWNTAENWKTNTDDPALDVPTNSDSVTIPSTGITNFPEITNDTEIVSLTMNDNSSITIASGKTLTVNMNVVVTKSSINNSGTLKAKFLTCEDSTISGTIETTGHQAYSGTTNLKEDTTLNITDNTENPSAYVTIYAVEGNSYNLKIDSQRKVEISGELSNINDLQIKTPNTKEIIISGGSSTINSATFSTGQTKLEGNFSAKSQTYGNVTLQGDTSLNAETYEFGKISGNHKLTLNTTKETTSSVNFKDKIEIQSLAVGSSAPSKQFSEIILPSSVTTTGTSSAPSNQIYNGPVTSSGTTFTAQSGPKNNNNITFLKGGTFSTDPINFTADTVTFGNNTDTVETKFNSTTEFNNSNITIEKNSTLIFVNTFENKKTLTNNGTLKLANNYTNSGTYTGSSDTIELNGSGAQSFTDNSTPQPQYGTIIISNTGTDVHTVTFDSNIKATSITNPNTTKCNITFNKNLTTTNAVNFTTTGTVTIGSTVNNAHTFDSSLTHTAGNTKIAGTVNASSVELGSINPSNTIEFTETSTITTTGGQTYNGKITAGSLTLTTTGTTGISINNGASINSITFNTDDPITINGPDSSIFELTGENSSLVIPKESTLSGTIKTKGSQTYKGAVTLAGNTKLYTPASIEFQSIITGNSSSLTIGDSASPATLPTPKKVSITNEISDISQLDITASESISLPGSVTTSGNQNYNGKVTLPNETTINADEKDITFKNNVTGANSLTINSANTILPESITTTGYQTYNTTLNINKNGSTLESSDGNITINNPITSGNKLTITVPNEGKNKKTITLPKSISTTGNQTFTGDVVLQADTSLDTYGNIIFNNTISPSDFSLKIGSTTAPNKLDFNSTVTTKSLNTKATTINLNGKITTTKTQEYDGDVYIKQSLVLKDPKKITFIGTLALDTNILTLSAHTLFYNTAITSTPNGKISAEGFNIVIDPTEAATIEAPITANKIIINNSEKNIKINNNLTATQDLAIYGSAYCTTDQESEVKGIYTYNFTAEDLKTILQTPPNSPNSQNNPPTTFIGSLTLGNTATLSATTTFYINGAQVTGEGTFKLPDNYNNITNKAEAFYSDFSTANITIETPERKKLVTEACILSTTDPNNQNLAAGWDSDTASPFEILEAHTIDDNVICVKFNRPIRFVYSGNNGLVNDTNKITYNKEDSETSYSDVFFKKNSNPPYTSISPIENDGTTNNIDIDTIYLATPDTWNTDATGTSAGVGTDKTGNKKNVIPHLNIPRNKADSDGNPAFTYFITDLYGKRLKHYSTDGATGTGIYTENKTKIEEKIPKYDQCAPALVSVSTGQELHTPNDLQSYDAHNFIEFRYSEPVLIGNSDSTSYDVAIYSSLNPKLDSDKSKYETAPQNISLDYSKTQTGKITNNTPGFTIAGLGTFTEGHIDTGLQSDGTQNRNVNTLYRKDSLSLRISIAGKTTKSGSNLTWDGFINPETIQPSGTAEIITGFVKDYSENSLSCDNINYTPASSTTTPTAAGLSIERTNKLTVNSTLPDYSNNSNIPAGRPSNDYTYGPWDLSAPTLAPINYYKTWKYNDAGKFNPSQYEILGYTSGAASVQRLEFHFLDNTPLYKNKPPEGTTTPETYDDYYWYSSNGWFNNETTDNQIGYCADIYGGSRPFVEKGQTTGGIRFHTVDSNAFHNDKGNFTSASNKAASSFYTGNSGTNTIGELYFSLQLRETNLPIDTEFNISYDPSVNKKFVTDLAGNKLPPFKNKRSIDKTPPAFNISLSPVNQNEIFLVFSKKLNYNIADLNFYNPPNPGEKPQSIKIKGFDDFNKALSLSFIISSDNPKAPKVNTDIPPVINTIRKTNGSEVTTIKLTLDKNVTYENLLNCYIELGPSFKYDDNTKLETSYDPVTGIKNSKVTIVRDENGNYMQMHSRHAISDFAINVINPLYAYNPDINNGDENYTYGLYEDGSWAVHDWSANQQNYGTLLANKPAQIVIDKNISGPTYDKYKIFITNQPDLDSISTQLNKDLNNNYRIWLPKGTFPSISSKNNNNYIKPTLTISKQEKSGSTPESPKETEYYYFDITEELAKQFGTNSQISFLFQTQDRICLNPKLNLAGSSYDYSNTVPLYCLRLSDPSDISSIDLWSYRTKTTKLQRGGVTVLNNVINNSVGEDAVVKVNVPSEGNLSVMILTLDGNIVKYLQRGKIDAGDYNYYWDGTNTNGTPVARGLYFVRVIGAGTDETRKIMVVN